MTWRDSGAATVIIGQPVRPGSEQEFIAWQHELNEAASHYPGFIGAEVTPPTAVQQDWVVVYRFDSIANVQAWMNSATRQDGLATGRHLLDGPPTQQVVGGAAKPTDQLVTVVVSHRVEPDDLDDFLAWQDRLRLAESKFDGFRGAELFRPSTVCKTSGRRCTATTPQKTSTCGSPPTNASGCSPKARSSPSSSCGPSTTRSAAGSPSMGAETGPPPSDVKTSLAVWMGLYPTVVFLTLALFAAAHAVVAEPAGRKPVLQLRHDLHDDAVLRQSRC